MLIKKREKTRNGHKSVLGVHWKDWRWSWNSNTLATWSKELAHWKRPWCWERLRAGGEGDHRGWDGWMASPTQWTWVWVDSGSWWWTGRPGVLWFMGSQRVRHNWVTELNWTEFYSRTFHISFNTCIHEVDITFPVYRWEHWGSEKWSHLSKMTWLESEKPEVEIQLHVSFQNICFWYRISK